METFRYCSGGRDCGGMPGGGGMMHQPSNKQHFLIAFKNGSVGVFECSSHTGSMGGVGASKTTSLRPEFVTAPAHSETIFDLHFCPANSNVFATCSYDGYVKLWSVAQKTSFREMYAGDYILYAV